MTRIQRDFEFHAISHVTSCVISHFNCSLFMDVGTDSPHEQSVAMDRMKFFIHEVINGSVFLKSENKTAIENYTKCSIRTCTLPEEPYDQIIAVALLLKLNAIAEGRLEVIDISLTSSNSDRVSFMHGIDDPMGPFEAEGWWSRSDISIMGAKRSSSKVVSLFNRLPSWDEIGLSWKEKDLILVPDDSPKPLDTPTP